MPFRKIKKEWQKDGLLNEALDLVGQMLKTNKKNFLAVTEDLLEKKEPSFDIYKRDQQVNKLEMGIRKKILIHLSITPSRDVTFSLLLLDVSRDAERSGDFCKNIYELAVRHPQKLHGEYAKKIRKTRDQIVKLFEGTWLAFSEEKKEKAEEMLDLYHKNIKVTLEEILDKILDKEKVTKEDVICALASRYFKRIGAHLANICSTVTNPFDRVRYIKEMDI